MTNLIGGIYTGSLIGVSETRLRYLSDCYHPFDNSNKECNEVTLLRNSLNSKEYFLGGETFGNTSDIHLYIEFFNIQGQTKLTKFTNTVGPFNNVVTLRYDYLYYPYDLAFIRSSGYDDKKEVLALARDGKLYKVLGLKAATDDPFKLIPSPIPFISFHTFETKLFGILEAADGILYFLNDSFKIESLGIQALIFLGTRDNSIIYIGEDTIVHSKDLSKNLYKTYDLSAMRNAEAIFH
ncbi:Hypothetical protein HVR_LOCUS273 [uncultured virus]|nr:Hypothetical protein HVR_LOCUS273 [uncultured virus]